MVSPFADTEAKLNAASACAMRVYGVRRCGNHAIINWLIRNSGAPAHVFLNSCTNRKSPIQTCGAAEVNGRLLRNKKWLTNLIESDILEPELAPFLLISYEAGFPVGFYQNDEQTAGFANSNFAQEVLITRSFVNWLPSFAVLLDRMNAGNLAQKPVFETAILKEISVYKAHLLAVQQMQGLAGFVIVNYDNWVSSPQYRLQKLGLVGFSEIDNSLGVIQRYGGGSSFSDLKNPVGMMVNARWKTMGKAKFGQVIGLALQDQELMALLAEFFPADIDILRGIAS